MVQLTGKYEHVKNENYAPHLVALGFSEEAAKKADETKYTLEIEVDGDNINVKAGSPAGSRLNTLVVGQEVEENLAGITLKNMTKIDGDTVTVSSITPTGLKYFRVHKFTDSGIEITSSSDDSSVPVAKRYYKRV